jgi:cell wall-associated NlpC family hydrolase
MNTSRAQEIVILEAVGIGAISTLAHIAAGKGPPSLKAIAATGLLAGGLSVVAIADGETAVALGGLAVLGVALAGLQGKSLGELALNQSSKIGTKKAPAAKGLSFGERLAAISAGKALSDSAEVAGAAVAGVGGGKGAKAYAACVAFVGTPYSWGGGGPGGPSTGIGRGAGTKGFDCSGLTEYGYSTVGISIGGTTYTQVLKGRNVDPNKPSEWKVGDLLFPHPGHVQMKGPGNKVVEAPHTGAFVQVVDQRSSYWKVRRITED